MASIWSDLFSSFLMGPRVCAAENVLRVFRGRYIYIYIRKGGRTPAACKIVLPAQGLKLVRAQGAAFPYVDFFLLVNQPSPTQAAGEVSTVRRRGWSLVLS
jgi:hypothetical protein